MSNTLISPRNMEIGKTYFVDNTPAILIEKVPHKQDSLITNFTLVFDDNTTKITKILDADTPVYTEFEPTTRPEDAVPQGGRRKSRRHRKNKKTRKQRRKSTRRYRRYR